MVINKIDLKPEEKKLKELKHILNCYSIAEVDNFEEHFQESFYRKELEEKKKELLIKLSDEQLRDYPDYINRVNILKDLGYIDQNERGIVSLLLFMLSVNIVHIKCFPANTSM